MKEVEKFLIEDGITPNLKGFHFLVYAIENYNKKRFTGEDGLHGDISTIYKTTVGAVERNMRIAVKKSKYLLRGKDINTTKQYVATVNLILQENIKKDDL